MTIKWNAHVTDADARADTNAPCGEYEVRIADVKRKTSKNNPNSNYCLVTFGKIAEGDVPGIFLLDDMHTGDEAKDNWLHSKACHTLESIAAAAGIDMSEMDIDESDPVMDAATQMIGATLRVEVIENSKLQGGKETIPVLQYGI